ncbi:non-specific serine/threonine protein kinase [Trifolium repens]|nr:non-specific serine/threonine protein kinase [Trifolium repens]
MRPLNLKTLDPQDGTVTTVTFCLALRPPLLKLTPGLVNFFQDAFLIAESDNNAYIVDVAKEGLRQLCVYNLFKITTKDTFNCILQTLCPNLRWQWLHHSRVCILLYQVQIFPFLVMEGTTVHTFSVHHLRVSRILKFFS